MCNRYIIIFSKTPEKFDDKAFYKVAETELYVHLIVAGDKFYVKDKEMDVNLVEFEVI